LVNEKDISNQALERAKNLIHGLDVNDYLYLAVTICFDSLLWTGDLKLSRGLKRKGYRNIITTKELKEIIKGL
jgi:predicted nucleic acid-binding protein